MSGRELRDNYRARSDQTRFGALSSLGDRSRIPGLDQELAERQCGGSPGLEMGTSTRVGLGYSYEAGSGQTRIGVLSRVEQRSGVPG